MKKHEKDILQSQLNSEKRALEELKRVYEKASQDCADKIAALSARTDMENLQSIIYQKQYQQALKKQIDGILDVLHGDEFETISAYLQACYDDGFISTMYSLTKQGIPLIVPIDQTAVVRAIQTDSKISKGLYERLGEDVGNLKTNIRAEISRGISNGSTYNEIAAKIAMGMNSPFNKAINNAIRITRTEGNRISNKSAMDAMYLAKEKGADQVKQWCAALDSRTRSSHRRLDGQIRDIGEEFSNGLQYPLDSKGKASEVVNCRCTILKRARWALGEEELNTLKERAAYYGLDKSDEFEEYKEKYLKAVESESVRKDAQMKNDNKNTFVGAKTIEEAQEYAKQFCNDGFMAKTFKGNVDYKGISVENANAINKALTDVYNNIGLDKISGIKVVSPTSAIGKKAFKDGADAVFAYSPVEHGIFINKNILKNEKAFAEYLKKSDDAWDLVMKNIENLSDDQKELALLYQKAGRSLVNGRTIEGMFTHELGHHAQWTLLDTKTNNAVGSRMAEYAPKISGYANASKSEYLAESFAAYMKGETDILDPEFVKFLNGKKVAKALENVGKSSIIQSSTQLVTIMPDEKFIEYALNPLKAPDKAEAFKKALGYTADNYEILKARINEKLDENKFVEKGDGGYGMRYEYVVNIEGVNGKNANVLTAWIQEGDNKRLVSVYVTDKKVTE